VTRCHLCLQITRRGRICQGCILAASERAGSDQSVRRRLVHRSLSETQWRVLDALAGGVLSTAAVARVVVVTVHAVARQLVNLRSARLVETERGGWLLSPSGRAAVRTRQVPPKVVVSSESRAAARERQRRFRERRKVVAHGGA